MQPCLQPRHVSDRQSHPDKTFMGLACSTTHSRMYRGTYCGRTLDHPVATMMTTKMPCVPAEPASCRVATRTLSSESHWRMVSLAVSKCNRADHGDGVSKEPEGAALNEGPEVTGCQLQEPLRILGACVSLLHKVLRQAFLLILRADGRL